MTKNYHEEPNLSLYYAILSRTVVRLRLNNGQSVSFEGKPACEKLVRWLYDYDLAIAKQIESLLNEKEKRNLELLLFRRE